MRILIDTNILIPLEDIGVDFNEKLAELSRMVSGVHDLLIHPASVEDIQRDKNEIRRDAMLSRMQKYPELLAPPELSEVEELELFGKPAKANHNVDNRILFSIYRNCAHWLVTQDEGIHKKAKALGIEERVFLLEQVIAALRKDDESNFLYPQIDNTVCHNLDLKDPFFDSLRQGYGEFDKWFEDKCCKTGRKAWVCKDGDHLGALCIYKTESDPIVTQESKALRGSVLKLCTFKVVKRGHKIGELFLKQAFNYAKENGIGYVYVTVDPENHDLLHELFDDFGFYPFGTDNAGRDIVYVKDMPGTPPETDDDPLSYAVKYFPTIKLADNRAFFVPIQPQYHQVLFPELAMQGDMFSDQSNSAGNAIKQAYLCRTPNKSIRQGDLLLFYRTHDIKAVTTYGVVDNFIIESDPEQIYQWVSKRTVYSYSEIVSMTGESIEVKVILFRLVGHLENPISFGDLKKMSIVSGPIQSITSVSKDSVVKIFEDAKINDCFISD